MKKIAILSLGAALAAVPVLAAPGGVKAGDADGDGVVTRAELEAGTSKMFARLDANGDGKLDASDRAAHRETMRARAFETMDADKNGSISRAEWDEHGRDIAQKRSDRRAKRAEAREAGEGRGHAMRGHHAMRGGHHRMLRRADTNGDNAVSAAEFEAAALARFEMVDANADGQVTAEERKAYRDAARAKRAVPTEG